MLECFFCFVKLYLTFFSLYLSPISFAGFLSLLKNTLENKEINRTNMCKDEEGKRGALRLIRRDKGRREKGKGDVRRGREWRTGNNLCWLTSSH